MNSFDVRIYALSLRKDRPKPYHVRWKVGGRLHTKAFAARALAENYRSDLMQATRRGEPFDVEAGLPDSLRKDVASGVTWYEHACKYMDMKWPQAAAKTRVSMADALATVTPVLVEHSNTAPDVSTLRHALIGWAFNPTRRETARPPKIEQALVWLSRHSVPMSHFGDATRRALLTRAALDACARKLDGGAAATTTARRKRAVLYNAMGHAVEIGLLDGNPVDAVQWKRAKAAAEEVDRRVVASPEQVRELLTAVTYVGRTVGPQLHAFFALLYFAALRPSEAMALKASDCELPAVAGRWGRLLLESSRPQAGRAWTDNGERTESRVLKWRGRRDVRPVPIPPELVCILRAHITKYGTAADGRLFRTALGGDYSPSAYWRAWQAARRYALSPDVAAGPLAGRPYDLRHGGVTLWLNAGVPAPEVARRAGHSVDVLLKVYAGCIDGQAGAANDRIARALEAGSPPSQA